MKLKAYLLVASAAFLGIAAETKNAKPVEGVNPGDLAPRINLEENESPIHFQNQNGRYTLINFWAAYDAESRARNVRLWNEVNKLNASTEKVAMYSISLDEKTSIFEETVKMDKLEGTAQLHERQGYRSDVFKKYQLDKGLKNFLVNDEGVIIAANVTPERLAELWKQI